MNNLSTKDLFSQIQDKLIIGLQENEILCPECRGLRFVLVEKNASAYIESCRACHTGKLYVCKYCEKGNKTDHCSCKEASEERNNIYRRKQAEKDYEAYKKAEKIHYKDYNGKFLLPYSDYLKDIEDVSEWVTDMLLDGEDIPEYLWSVEGVRHFSINIKDIISDKCEDGYEDMYSNLDTESPLLLQAQELIDQWQDEQGERLYIFNESYVMAVVIKGLVDEVRRSK